MIDSATPLGLNSDDNVEDDVGLYSSQVRAVVTVIAARVPRHDTGNSDRTGSTVINEASFNAE